MNNKLPMIRKEGIFYRIKEWFKKLFHRDEILEQQVEEEKIEKVTVTERVSFINSLKVESKGVIVALQRKLKNEDIKIEDLSDDELYEMIELYIKQIDEKTDKLGYQLKRLRNKGIGKE